MRIKWDEFLQAFKSLSFLKNLIKNNKKFDFN